MENRLQKIFDVCAVHMVKQNKKSQVLPIGGTSGIDNYGVYFKGELGCGTMPLLDQTAKRDKETIFGCIALNRTRISQVPSHYFKDEFKDMTIEEINLAQEIQDVHDRRPVSCWRADLRTIAIKYGLSTKNLDEVPLQS